MSAVMLTPTDAPQSALDLCVEQFALKQAEGAGRPSRITPELASRIVDAVAEGTPLYTLCREAEWCPTWHCVWLWIDKYPEFGAAIARARQKQAHSFADQATQCGTDALQAIQGDRSDSARINAYRLKHDALKWRAGVHAPEYRDKQQNVAVGMGINVTITGLSEGIKPPDIDVISKG